MDVSVRSAKYNEREILDHLIQLYLHDFSEFEALDINEEGRYEYPYLIHYWNDPNRYPFLIRVDGKLAGFALLRFEIDPTNGLGQMNIAEFFITRHYRRQKAGAQAAVKLWNLFPGSWELKVLSTNKTAYPFWRQTITEYTHNRFVEKKSQEFVSKWITFSFESKGTSD